MEGIILEIVQKDIQTLLPGDIVLHPIFRQDGLILIGRYKKITSSLLSHLKVQCDNDFPVLVLENESEFNFFMDTAFYKNEKFVHMLRYIYRKHKNYLTMKLSFASYTEYTDADRQSDLHQRPKTLLAFLLTNPSWTNLENVILSPSTTQRARKVKLLIINSLQEDPSIHNLFEKMSHFHNALLTHSVNTMCASLSIGLAMELTDIELKNLAFSTLFADIGYTRMDRQKFINILNTGERNVYIAEHIRQSIDIIKDSPTCRDKSLIMGVLDHHEYFDGSGFPNGKSGEEISLFGRIIAISQAYDELVGGYIKESSIPILVAQSMIWDERRTKWDNQILSAFVYRREFCKTGQEVVLKDNRRGRIIGFTDFTNYPLNPIVQIDNEMINFYKDKNLFSIKSVIRNS